MRRPLLGLVVALGVSAVASEARAQVPFGSVNDPFFTYYSFYLPRQAAQAAQSGPEATISAWAANRQQYAATNRNGMFDPNNAGSSSFDDDFALNSGARKRSISTSGQSRYGLHGGNLNGLGPQGYFGGGKLVPYYRDLKTGRGRNANLAPVRGRGAGGASMSGYGGSGGGLPGPR